MPDKKDYFDRIGYVVFFFYYQYNKNLNYLNRNNHSSC